ncbi:hypothetical protein D1AOALGA4SA_4901 [Olavius algarvensis Delta 1 endosymbiont]|nr:hypothetical protein D1AOALGA4SA_4901 [Olavius algarvensis Delta 1 endosymbiont]
MSFRFSATCQMIIFGLGILDLRYSICFNNRQSEATPPIQNPKSEI